VSLDRQGSGGKPGIYPLPTQILENDQNWERKEICQTLIQEIKIILKIFFYPKYPREVASKLSCSRLHAVVLNDLSTGTALPLKVKVKDKAIPVTGHGGP
jgi:hypothetical protein